MVTVMVGHLRTLGKGMGVIALLMMLGLALLGGVSPVNAQGEDVTAVVDEIVAAVAELPELSALTPEEQAELQASLSSALEAAILEDVAGGAEVDVSVDAIVEAVQSTAASGVTDVQALVDAAVAAYEGQ